MKRTATIVATFGLVLPFGFAQEEGASEAKTDKFAAASSSIQERLERSLEELSAVNEEIQQEKVDLNRQISALEAELREERRAAQDAQRLLDGRTVTLSNLQKDIQAREAESQHLSNYLQDYLREFETRLHIAELSRYHDAIDGARQATESKDLAPEDVFARQAHVLARSLDRIEEAFRGARFEGRGVDAIGTVKDGEFVLVGPAAVFRSNDGLLVGTAEQRVNSLEPSIVEFPQPDDRRAASELVTSGEGTFPLDPTLGNAHKIAATEETFVEHVQKGGPVMYPIFGMAAVGLLIALYKWIALSLQRRPSRKQLEGLYAAVDRRDQREALKRANGMGGPVGRMLTAGVEHLDEPRELIEEVMYERMLTTRLKLQRLLPFIAICAASAPLLGLLGTVTGIINTFKMITVFGSDIKNLSGGISEALITTKFGLIVAIPSLLLHAFLSRKARGIIGQMEGAAVAFMNHVSKAEPTKTVVPAARREDSTSQGGVDAGAVRAQVEQILGQLLGPLVDERRDELTPQQSH
ncbi:MAG: MotA/TolQ/ExbB proton channel family protein [Planctomycetes bacterium]|nr:MotA/TolQ/ExbB proton channel family protein [Planctomycetota bacterium]